MSSPAKNFFLIDYKFYTMKASLDSQKLKKAKHGCGESQIPLLDM